MTAPKVKIPAIYAAITAILSDIGTITKASRNKQQGFMYRGIDQVYEAIHPLLSKHKVIVLPELLTIEKSTRTTNNGSIMQITNLTMKYTFVAEDGTTVSMTMPGEGMDMADKSTAKACSVAQKYAFFQMFCIPATDVIDADEVTPEPTKTRELTAAELETLDAASKVGHSAFVKAWKECQNNGHFIASVEQIAQWKKQSDEADAEEQF